MIEPWFDMEWSTYPSHYDAIEIHGVRNVNCSDGTVCVEVCDEAPEWYSVYLHYSPESRNVGVDCIGDFEHLPDAQAFAKAIEDTYGWPVYNYAECGPKHDEQNNVWTG